MYVSVPLEQEEAETDFVGHRERERSDSSELELSLKSVEWWNGSSNK